MQLTESLQLSWTLLVVVIVVVLAAPKQEDESNLIDYMYGVEPLLRSRVHAAFKAESITQQNGRPVSKSCSSKLEPSCPSTTFRTPTGVCNNVRHPFWGARGSSYLRLLPSVYTDGISKPNTELPSATNITSQIRQLRYNNNSTHKDLSSLSGVWAEFLLRDISLPVYPKLAESCCQSGTVHSECFTGVSESGGCLNYWRNLPTLSTHICNFGAREPMNGASGFLDGSDVYGNTDDEHHRLRTHEQGHVNVSKCELCNRADSSIGHLHQAILAEHNRIADDLAKINNAWSDSKLYNEARRGVVAQLQHITFNEFVPSVLGETALNTKELVPLNSGSYKGYSSNNQGGAFDAVALAALQALTTLKNNEGSDLEKQTTLAAKKVDLNEAQVKSVEGWDTNALLIHMARDYGLPGYVEYVKFCTSGKVQLKDFADLKNYMEQKDVQILEKIYIRVEDVDLFIGGNFETPDKGAAMGPTFTCLLREQLIRIRTSDRFWYENDVPPSSLKSKQIAEIRQVKLSGFLCANAKMTKITKIQPKPFIQQDAFINSKINCDQYSPLNLTDWSEKTVPNAIADNTNSVVTDKNTVENVLSDINPEIILEAYKKALDEIKARKELEHKSYVQQKAANPDSSIKKADSFSRASEDALRMADKSILFELVTKNLIEAVPSFKKQTGLVLTVLKNELNELLKSCNISGLVPHENPTNHAEVSCPLDILPCDPTSCYRTFTGRCNNLKNPSFGQSLTTYIRLLPSAYDDVVSNPKMNGVNETRLPNPRLVSTRIHRNVSVLHRRYTHMLMQYAQFVDHDINQSPKGIPLKITSCRACDSATSVHPECNPIPILPHDSYFPETNETNGQPFCIPTIRSLAGQQSLGSREQVNQNTHYLDASVIYGDNACINKIIRSPENGRMNITKHKNQGKDLLPQSATHPECTALSGFCFIGGDSRTSIVPGLAVMHTIWVREHNRIVERLRLINPHWDGEKLFQETRRIIGAMLQHITYNELLPRIIGQSTVYEYELNLLSQGYYEGYSPECNGGMFNEFATAAYRLGHSLVRADNPRLDKNYKELQPSVKLRETYFNPDMLYERDAVDEIIRGLVDSPMESLDQFFTEELTNHLFEERHDPFSGFDLIAINIHRSRDHGLPGYNKYRDLCGLKKAKTFDDLSEEIDPEIIADLKMLYASVDDIDLFPGGMSEYPLPGGLAGPTFACIIAKQFNQTRKCDRFWYETANPKIRFTETQLGEIRRVSLAKVMCNNMNTEENIQKDVFDSAWSDNNARISCKSLHDLDLEFWRETVAGCDIGSKFVEVGKYNDPTPCTRCSCTNTGVQCESLIIESCSELITLQSRDDILKDEACVSQCGSIINTMDNSTDINGFMVPDISEFYV